MENTLLKITVGPSPSCSTCSFPLCLLQDPVFQILWNEWNSFPSFSFSFCMSEKWEALLLWPHFLSLPPHHLIFLVMALPNQDAFHITRGFLHIVINFRQEYSIQIRTKLSPNFLLLFLFFSFFFSSSSLSYSPPSSSSSFFFYF